MSYSFHLQSGQKYFKMKKLFLFTCTFILLLSINSFGQSMETGVKVGLNLANVGDTYTNSFGPKSITTFNAGMFTKFNIAYLLALQPELLYTMKGYKVTYLMDDEQGSPSQNGNRLATANISYLEIPVPIKIKYSIFLIWHYQTKYFGRA